MAGLLDVMLDLKQSDPEILEAAQLWGAAILEIENATADDR